MFATIGRSWEFAKISYGIIWDFKQLLVFPVISMIASLLILATFAVPLFLTGTLEGWLEAETGMSNPIAYAVMFAFYFCSYFVMIFFNTALTACAMKVIAGETPSVGDGLRLASARLPQILGWTLVSALVGIILRAIESNEKVGKIVSALIGSAWTVLTYFVVPVLVIDGLGPVGAIKKSASTLRETWGTSLAGHFSLGFLSFLIMLPVFLVGGGLVFLGMQSGQTAALVGAIVVAAALVLIAVAVTSAADVVFKAVLYNYATGKATPENIDDTALADAFGPK